MKDLIIPQAENSSVEPNQLLMMMQSFDKFADYIINSDYKKAFEKEVKTEDGGKLTIVEKSDIVSCMMLGHELGISPMGSIALGKKLNAKSYFSVKKGESLGIDPITSMSKIYNISTSNGDIISLAVDIITKTIIDSKSELTIVRDFDLVPKFYIVDTVKTYVGHLYDVLDNDGILKDKFFIVTKDTKPDDVQKALAEDKIFIQKQGYTNVTSVRGYRPSINLDVTIHYSIQEAIDAGLYKGFHSVDVDQSGKSIYTTGKSNWNNHPKAMLRNRAISILGRILVADKLQGSYSHEEAMDIVNVNSEDELINYQ